MASARSLMRLGSGRSLASVSKGSSSSASAGVRAFTTTPLRGAVKVNPVASDPDVVNTRQAQRPRTLNLFTLYKRVYVYVCVC